MLSLSLQSHFFSLFILMVFHCYGNKYLPNRRLYDIIIPTDDFMASDLRIIYQLWINFTRNKNHLLLIMRMERVTSRILRVLFWFEPICCTILKKVVSSSRCIMHEKLIFYCCTKPAYMKVWNNHLQYGQRLQRRNFSGSIWQASGLSLNKCNRAACVSWPPSTMFIMHRVHWVIKQDFEAI